MGHFRPETDRFFEKVEKRSDGCWIWTAAVSEETGYGHFRLSRTRKLIGAHVWSFQHHRQTKVPKGKFVTHTCLVYECVNPAHLRLADNKQRGQNLNGLTAANTTGYRGVWYCKRTGRYAAQVVVDGKTKFLGRYPTAEIADEIARDARLKAYEHNYQDQAGA